MAIDIERTLAQELFEVCWNATSKLESQLARNSDLPESYRDTVDRSFDALRTLDRAISDSNS